MFCAPLRASHADMAELADALASGASGGNLVQVQLLLSAPAEKESQPETVGILFSFFQLKV